MPHKTYTVQVGVNQRYYLFNYSINSKTKQPLRNFTDPNIGRCRISGLQAQHRLYSRGTGHYFIRFQPCDCQFCTRESIIPVT